MRYVAMVGVVLLFSGCGLVRQAQMREQIANLRAKGDAAGAECRSRYPLDEPKTAVAKTTCLNMAMNIMRPLMPFPDLLDLQMANNLAVAERFQSGQLTLIQAGQVIAEKWAELNAEEQRRLLANRSVGAQEDMASAAWQATRPRTCIAGPQVVGCF